MALFSPLSSNISNPRRLEEDRDNPLLFNLAAGRDLNSFGTLKYRNRWNLFDQVAVSPGLLDDEGWACLPDTFQTIREGMEAPDGGPRPFSKEVNQKLTFDHNGFADHFPVTVWLKVKE